MRNSKLVLLLAALVSVFAPSLLPAAISLNVATNGGAVTTGNLTFSLAVGAGANRVAIVGCGFDSANAISSVVFNTSESFAAVTGTIFTESEVGGKSQYWVLVNPTATTANVVVTPSANGDLVCGAVVYNGVDQSTPTSGGTGCNSSSCGTDAVTNITISSATGDLALGQCVQFNRTLNLGTSQTQRYEQERAGAGLSIHGSEEAGAASVAWTCTWTGNQENLGSGLNLKAAAEAAAACPRGSMMLGVGC